MSEKIDSTIPEEIAVEEVVVETPKAEEPEVITIPEATTDGDKDLGALDSGAIGTKKPKPKADKPKVEETKVSKSDDEATVAIYSSRNVTWTGVGKVFVGYNIVTEKQAESWLTRAHVRLATPEEVAKEFGL